MYALVDGFGEETQCESGSQNQREGATEDHIQFAVLDTGFGCNDRRSAPLATISDSDEERLALDVDAFAFQLIVFGLVGEDILHNLLKISPEATRAGFLELLADRGVEARTACGKERMIVGQAIVAADRRHVVQRLNGIGGTQGRTHMACKAVPAADRNDSEGGVRTPQATGYLVDGSVSADGHDRIEAQRCVVSGQFDAMALVFSEHDVGHPLLFVQQFIDNLRNAPLVQRSGDRVDNKCDVLHRKMKIIWLV